MSVVTKLKTRSVQSGSSCFELVPLPGPVLMAIVGITVLYITASECTKKIFFQHFRTHSR